MLLFLLLTHLLLVFFLISIFDVRWFNGAYLSYAYVPRLMKFTKFMDESVEKNKSISRTQVGYKILPKMGRKRLFEQKYIFL